MIKRLKWNVLHADDDDDPGGLSSSSEESDQQLSHAAALQVLLHNDPELNPSRSAHDDVPSNTSRLSPQPQARNRRGASSDDEFKQQTSSDEDEVERDERREQANGTAPNEDSLQDMGHGFAEWKECLLCPGKKFFNEGDLQLHVESKKHLKALRKQSASHQQPKLCLGNNQPQTETASDAHDDEQDERKTPRSPQKATPPTHLTSSKSTSKSEGNSDLLEKVAHALAVAEARAAQKHDTGMNEAHKHETPDEQDRKRAKRKKEAAKRKLRALKRRKWEKRNKDKAIHDAETLCK